MFSDIENRRQKKKFKRTIMLVSLTKHSRQTAWKNRG
jgi:hypothetical protein